MAFYRRSKNTDKPLLKQIIDRIPAHLFQFSVKKHQSDKGCSKYKTFDQMVALIFGQLNKCYTLADISYGLSISQTFLADIGLKQSPAQSTMSDGNKNRNYQVFETLYHRLLSYYKRSLKSSHQEHVIKEIESHKIKLIDSTTISLCLSMFDCDKTTAFSNFCERIRICLLHYLSLDYICNDLRPVVKKVEKPPEKTLFDIDNSGIQLELLL